MGAEKKQRTEERNPGEPRTEVREQSAGRVGGGPAQGGRETVGAREHAHRRSLPFPLKMESRFWLRERLAGWERGPQ